ncbi:cation diffusion facilitator family transporter [Actibacterium sp.]|uniref:cation diffusion facilitator family transporter n=1 Tax=Actibacterium sp. TaxID=1872125 RepID=UPI00356436BB
MARNPNLMNLSAGLASVSVALVLVLLKLWALGETQALSIAASLADSAMDLMVSLGGLAAIIYAARPADEDHHFGHSSAEDLAALGQALFILVSAGVIFWAAARRILSDDPVHLMAQGRGIVVMVVSVALTLGLVLWQRRVARKTGSRVVKADQLHYLGDLLPNLGAILALWASVALDLQGVDSAVAMGAAVMLAVGALGIGRGAWHALMDRSADPEIVAGIEAIARDWPGLHGFHDLQTRTAGSKLFINLHIELDGEQTLHQAHSIGAGLKHALIQAFPNAEVIIHKDPVRD